MEHLLQKRLLLHLCLLFYGNQINRAVTSMTNQNKVHSFLRDWLNARRCEKMIFIAGDEHWEKSLSCLLSGTPTKFCKRGRKPKIDAQKNSSCRFGGVNFTSGGEIVSFDYMSSTWSFMMLTNGEITRIVALPFISKSLVRTNIWYMRLLLYAVGNTAHTSFPSRRNFIVTSRSGFNLNSLWATMFKSAKALASTSTSADILVVLALPHKPILLSDEPIRILRPSTTAEMNK